MIGGWIPVFVAKRAIRWPYVWDDLEPWSRWFVCVDQVPLDGLYGLDFDGIIDGLVL